MKIAVCGPTDPDSFADNVIDSLRRMGHEVQALGTVRPALPFRRLTSFAELASDHERRIDGLRQRRLANRVQNLAPDLLLTIDRRLHPSVIAAAHESGARVVLWFPDATGTMGNHDMFLAGYDRIYLKNPALAKELHSVQGLPVKYLPEAANSSWHQSDVPYGIDKTVVMAGNVHPTRALLLDRLLADGIPLRIYGSGVPAWINLPRVRQAHTGQYLARGHKANVFRSARAVLNNLHPAESHGTNCRLFEGAACGAAVVTEEREGLRDLFEPDQEVFTFDTYTGLLVTLQRLLDDPEVGRPVADAAATRAHRDHTYEQRLNAVFDDVFS